MLDPKWMPKATGTTPGIVQPGEGLLIDNGVMTPVARKVWLFDTGSMESPLDPNWPLATHAAPIPDPLQQSILVRGFSATANSGIGFCLGPVPACNGLRFTLFARGQTAPGSTSGVALKLYTRALPTTAVVGSWPTTPLDLATVYVSNAFWQKHEFTKTLAELGWQVGSVYQNEIIRSVLDDADTYAYGFYLRFLQIETV